MTPPEVRLEPISREKLWRQTLLGYVVVLFGLGVIAWYVVHAGHEHALDKSILLTGVGAGFTGMFMVNKKLTKEWLAELRKFVPFVKSGGDAL